jgi:two-component system nitrate/nitrite response regulator NarL
MSKNPEIKTIIVIDDHEIFRAGLRMICNQGIQPQPEIYDYSNIEDALISIRKGLVPHLILTDLLLPGISGLDGLQIINKACPSSILVLMTALSDRQLEFEALNRKAHAFMDKTISPVDLIDNIKKWLNMAPEDQGFNENKQLSIPVKLTDRQIEVLNLLSQGKSNKLIARHLNLSENTIRVHVSAILEQMKCTSRQEAAEKAKRQGFIFSK